MGKGSGLVGAGGRWQGHEEHGGARARCLLLLFGSRTVVPVHAFCLPACLLVWLSLPVAPDACQAAVGFTPMSMSAYGGAVPGGVRSAGPAMVGPAVGTRLSLVPAMPPIPEAHGGANLMEGDGSGSAAGYGRA